MGFFDDLKNVGSDLLAKSSVVAKEAAQKAQDAAEMAKIKIDIAAREKEIKDLYAQIGKAFYEANKENAAEYAEEIAEINAKFVLIDELNNRYAMFKDNMAADTEAETAEVNEVIDITPEDVAETVEN